VIDALISGRVYGTPAQRTAKNGKPFAVAKLRTSTRNGESVFVSVISFAGSAVNALLALGDGDSAAISGELSMSIYSSQDGTPRVGLDLVAHSVLTAYAVSRRRKAVAGDSDEPTGAEQSHEARATEAPARADRDELDDDIPF
jgi:single-stranded DNA-binding protein